MLSPETAHNTATAASALLPSGFLKKNCTVKSKFTRCELGGKRLANPIGLAGGFDKNGDLGDFLSSLGFGFLEFGSVTAKPCDGNPKPRLFRLENDHSIINRMGLPNVGSETFAKKMLESRFAEPYGVNIAKTPNFAQPDKQLSGIDDYIKTYRRVHYLGLYTVLNLSCPNSGENKTFEDPRLFKDLAHEITNLREDLGQKKPLFIKLSPDLELAELKKTVTIALQYDFDGFIVSNTTRSRTGLKTANEELNKIGMGGLSGAALEDRSNKQIQAVHNIVKDQATIIGVGGVMSFDALIRKFVAGASLAQVYTGLIYNGPFFIRDLNKELIKFCKQVGANNYQELVGQKDILKKLSS